MFGALSFFIGRNKSIFFPLFSFFFLLYNKSSNRKRQKERERPKKKTTMGWNTMKAPTYYQPNVHAHVAKMIKSNTRYAFVPNYPHHLATHKSKLPGSKTLSSNPVFHSQKSIALKPVKMTGKKKLTYRPRKKKAKK